MYQGAGLAQELYNQGWAIPYQDVGLAQKLYNQGWAIPHQDAGLAQRLYKPVRWASPETMDYVSEHQAKGYGFILFVTPDTPRWVMGQTKYTDPAGPALLRIVFGWPGSKLSCTEIPSSFLHWYCLIGAFLGLMQWVGCHSTREALPGSHWQHSWFQ
ncbi:hypothetical protein DEU56DRAFT_752446 [Suillus clintonianus]|uniref:uncharacterized protein n=1 Tax=Suillus clintonianus TaxID=1904413 RepID=UPI001B8692FA|nr:uncharacterized protein DEU56DRAFT_752446 [Suillus clintonianus]KAG2150772.1 hypothetical protein DEU56DRAFT_752446 [Suillus clintonianus]